LEFTTEQLGWIKEVAAVYASRSPEPVEDLRQVAALGLINALQRYDPANGLLKPYALRTMRGEIQHYLRDKSFGRYLLVPASASDRYRQIEKAWEAAIEAGRLITLDEVGIATQGRARWLELKRVMGARQMPLHLDSALEETIGWEPAEDALDEQLYSAMAELPPDIAAVIRSHFFEGESIEAISKRFSVDPSVITYKIEEGVNLLGFELSVCN